MLVCTLAPVIHLALDVASEPEFGVTAIHMWNAGVRFGVPAFAAYPSARLADFVAHESQLARTDPLTELMNRRAFDEAATFS